MGLQRCESLNMSSIGEIDRSDIKESIIERLKEYDCLSSTNEFCKSDFVEDRQIVLARTQTNGHGRMGRRFVSAEGGFYVSFCYKDGVVADRLACVTGMCAVATRRAIEKTCGVKADIKWLNDLMLKGKKICGILVEAEFSGLGDVEKLIIGVGINANQRVESFEGEIAEIASSIFALEGKSLDTDRLLVNLTEEIDRAFDVLFGDGDIDEYIEDYKRYCTTLGRNVQVLSSAFTGGKDPREVFASDPSLFPTVKAVDIDDSFGLITVGSDGERKILRSGEVSVR